MELLAVAIFLAVVNQKIVDYFAAPFKQREPERDFWWLLYVALLSGLVIGWFSEINLFDPYIPSALLGRILTAILIGGGSSLIYDVFDDRPQVVIETPVLVTEADHGKREDAARRGV